MASKLAEKDKRIAMLEAEYDQLWDAVVNVKLHHKYISTDTEQAHRALVALWRALEGE